MDRYEACVDEFHNAMKVSATQEMSVLPSIRLQFFGDQLVRYSKDMEAWVGDKDKRFLRCHLMMEELGECIQAMAAGDEVTALDGLTDLLYVLIGTSLTFDWPLRETFTEVHRSNMTKIPQDSDKSRERIRDKGPAFQRPLIKEILEAWRKKQ